MTLTVLQKVVIPDAHPALTGNLAQVPLVYLKKMPTESPGPFPNAYYNAYVSVVVPSRYTLKTHFHHEVTGATTFIKVEAKDDPDGPLTGYSTIYFMISNVPRPRGFRVATLRLVITGIEDGDQGPEGGRPTSVDYADADENP